MSNFPDCGPGAHVLLPLPEEVGLPRRHRDLLQQVLLALLVMRSPWEVMRSLREVIMRSTLPWPRRRWLSPWPGPRGPWTWGSWCTWAAASSLSAYLSASLSASVSLCQSGSPGRLCGCYPYLQSCDNEATCLQTWVMHSSSTHWWHHSCAAAVHYLLLHWFGRGWV